MTPESSNLKSAKTCESLLVVLTSIGLEISVPLNDSRLTNLSPGQRASLGLGSLKDCDDKTGFLATVPGDTGGLTVGLSRPFLFSVPSLFPTSNVRGVNGFFLSNVPP